MYVPFPLFVSASTPDAHTSSNLQRLKKLAPEHRAGVRLAWSPVGNWTADGRLSRMIRDESAVGCMSPFQDVNMPLHIILYFASSMNSFWPLSPNRHPLYQAPTMPAVPRIGVCPLSQCFSDKSPQEPYVSWVLDTDFCQYFEGADLDIES